MSNQIIYLDDSLLVINKPANLAAVPGGWEKETHSLLALLEADYGKLWIVHRLDKGTSGVILFARNPAAHRSLSQLFETHAITKTYHAIVCGIPSWDEHTARHRLRADVGHAHRTVVDHKRGKPAVTSFRVLERFTHHTLLAAMPVTGRTHQIRAHLMALGFPILAEVLYATPGIGRDSIHQYIFRPALHACSIEFEFEGKPFFFTASYPDDFAIAINKLRASC